MARKAIYNGQELVIANDALTPEQVKDAFANTSYPELKNATAYEDDEGNIRFQLQAGTKGARKAIYNGQELVIANDELTAEQVKDAFANTSYPELKNATAYEDDEGNIRFQLQAGTKGARKAVYNGQELVIANDALTPEQVKDAFANTSYPELKNATAYEDDEGNIRFQLQAGTKGARKAIYNGQELVIANEDLTPEQVKDAFANTSYPELKNATAYEDDEGNIRFQLQAGTKGN